MSGSVKDGPKNGLYNTRVTDFQTMVHGYMGVEVEDENRLCSFSLCCATV